jgi:hypothetical protein
MQPIDVVAASGAPRGVEQRSAARTYAPPNARLQVDGFRIARDL